jgi:molybdenum cofactor biosynthesis enzyme
MLCMFPIEHNYVEFGALTAVTVKGAVIWDMMPLCSVEVH